MLKKDKSKKQYGLISKDFTVETKKEVEETEGQRRERILKEELEKRGLKQIKFS